VVPEITGPIVPPSLGSVMRFGTQPDGKVAPPRSHRPVGAGGDADSVIISVGLPARSVRFSWTVAVRSASGLEARAARTWGGSPFRHGVCGGAVDAPGGSLGGCD